MKLLEMLGKVEELSKKNSPLILTGFAIAGVFTTAYSAFKAGPRASKILEDYRKDMELCRQNDKEAKKAVRIETVKKMAPVVAPTFLIGSITIGCIIGSQSINSKRIAVLSAAYSLSESTVRSLNGKMNEMLGEKKTQVIKESVMKDKLKKDSDKDKKILSDGQAVIPNDGTVLCKDLYSGRLFYSSAEKIRQAIAKCSYNMINEMYISLNDFYDEIGSRQLEPIPMGNDLGWNIDDVQKGLLPITLTALLLDDGRPILCMDYDVGVRADYRHLH